jgi:hypothetical protein
MKLETYAIIEHLRAEFGPEINPLHIKDLPIKEWQVCSDQNIRLVFNGNICFWRINGSAGRSFAPDLAKLKKSNTQHLYWTNGFSWMMTDKLAREFSTDHDAGLV